MRDKAKNNLCFVATIVFLLLSIDFVSAYLPTDNHFELCCNCPDFSKHSGHSHNHAFTDEVYGSESGSNQRGPEVSSGFLLSQNILPTESYFSKIWQPPKIS